MKIHLIENLSNVHTNNIVIQWKSFLYRAGRKDSPLVSEESTKRAAGKPSGEAAVAPVVPFGMDLYYWDNPKDVEPMTLAP